MQEIYFIKKGHHLPNGWDPKAVISIDRVSDKFAAHLESSDATTDDMSDIDELIKEEYGN